MWCTTRAPRDHKHPPRQPLIHSVWGLLNFRLLLTHEVDLLGRCQYTITIYCSHKIPLELPRSGYRSGWLPKFNCDFVVRSAVSILCEVANIMINELKGCQLRLWTAVSQIEVQSQLLTTQSVLFVVMVTQQYVKPRYMPHTLSLALPCAAFFSVKRSECRVRRSRMVKAAFAYRVAYSGLNLHDDDNARLTCAGGKACLVYCTTRRKNKNEKEMTLKNNC